MSCCGIHLITILQKILIVEMSLKFTYLRLYSNSPGANELNKHYPGMNARGPVVGGPVVGRETMVNDIYLTVILCLNGLMQERHNSIADALDLSLSCTTPLFLTILIQVMAQCCQTTSHDLNQCLTNISQCHIDYQTTRVMDRCSWRKKVRVRKMLRHC